MRIKRDPLRYLPEEAAGYVAEGFKVVKLKVGFGVEEDAAVTRAVREAAPLPFPMVAASASRSIAKCWRGSRQGDRLRRQLGCMTSAIRRMIGSGMPTSQSSAPFTNSMPAPFRCLRAHDFWLRHFAS
jgi:hypothetical protein